MRQLSGAYLGPFSVDEWFTSSNLQLVHINSGKGLLVAIVDGWEFVVSAWVRGGVPCCVTGVPELEPCPRLLGVLLDPSPRFIILPKTVTSSQASLNISLSIPSVAS